MEGDKKFIKPPKRTSKDSDKEKRKSSEPKDKINESKSVKENHMKRSLDSKKTLDKKKKHDIKKRGDSGRKSSFLKNGKVLSRNKKGDFKNKKILKNKEEISEDPKKDNRPEELIKKDRKVEHSKKETSSSTQEKRVKPKTSYKRSDSKYHKEKGQSTRSNPKCEYNLEDADENEKELVLRGTISDRLNVLALLCARNPSEANYKQLLQFCENQRNDVIYNTLKLLRDLIKEKPIESISIKGRILKSFEMVCKNQYIKDKIIQIVGVLARADIYSEDFINILLTRLIEKDKPLTLVEEALKSLFSLHEQLICDGIEDVYFKNDNFRVQYNILKFIQQLEINNTKKAFFNFYNTAMSSLEDYPQDQKDLMIELLVNGLSRTISEGDKVESIVLIRKYVKSARSIISCLNLLMITKDPFTESYVLKVSRTTMLRNTKNEPEFLNMIYKLNNKDLFCKLIDNSFYYSVHSILSLMLIAYSKKIDTSYMFSLKLFCIHYNPVVRDVARKMLNNEKLYEFDPFDRVYLDGLAKRLEDREF